MIDFYHHPVSSNAQLVRMVLEEKGLTWRDHFVDLQTRANLDPAYLSLNPEGLVPTLVHDQKVLTESTVIARYLDRVFREPVLQPPEPAKMAAIDWWLFRVAGLQNATHDITYACVFSPRLKGASPKDRAKVFDGIPDPALKARRIRVVEHGLQAPDVRTAMRYFRRSIVLLGEQLNDDYIAGDAVTLADIAVAPYLFRPEQLNLSSLWQAESSAIGQWYLRMKARRSFERAITGMIPPEIAEMFASAGQEASAELIARSEEED